MRRNTPHGYSALPCWFPQRKREITYPTCDGCGIYVAAPSPLREDGLVAHDSRCLEVALRKKRGYVHSQKEVI